MNEFKDVKLSKAYRHILLGVNKNEKMNLYELRGKMNPKIGTVMPLTFKHFDKFDVDACICHSDYMLCYKSGEIPFRWDKLYG